VSSIRKEDKTAGRLDRCGISERRIYSMRRPSHPIYIYIYRVYPVRVIIILLLIIMITEVESSTLQRLSALMKKKQNNNCLDNSSRSALNIYYVITYNCVCTDVTPLQRRILIFMFTANLGRKVVRSNIGKYHVTAYD